MEDSKHTGARLRLRSCLAGGVLVLSAVTALGCGDSSDDKAAAPAAKAAATTKAATPAATPTTPTTSTNPVAAQYTAEGTVRLMAKRLGWPGTLVVVGPKGTVDANNERWYKVGTKVKLRAASTKTARFVGWSGTGGCTGKAPVCTVQVKKGVDYTRVYATFLLNKKAAKHLKKSDPALINGVYPDGSGPPKS
jgi:hypothetical protein